MLCRVPTDAEITFADHMGRFYAHRFAFPPMVGRLIGYLAICDPPEQSIGELAEALLASRSAITNAVKTLETMHLIRRMRVAGERMDRVRLDPTSPQAHGTGHHRVPGAERTWHAKVWKSCAMRPQSGGRCCWRWSAFADFLIEQTKRMQQEWQAAPGRAGRRGEAARAAGPREAGMTPAIVATGVRKSFGETLVLDGVDLTVDEGTIFALLGPNGAGKTTIVRILSTLIPADAGDVRVAGHDLPPTPTACAPRSASPASSPRVDDLLTGEENLQLMADLNHLGRAGRAPSVAELLERFDLVDAARRPASTYSGGMRRRLDLAMTLVGSPQVIFLDEPTTGLDPRSRRTMWDDIRELAAGGVTILLTTQYLDEADQLADRIAVLDRGRIVAEGTADELKRRIPGGHVRLQFADAGRAARGRRPARRRLADEERLDLQVPSDGSVASLRRLLEQLDDADIEVAHLSIHTPDLDDVFFAVTGHPRRRGGRQCHDHPRLHTHRLAHDAAPQPAPPAALPLDDAACSSACRSCSCCCSSSSSAASSARASAASWRAGTTAAPATSTTSRPASC